MAFRRRVGPALLANTAVTWVGVVVVLLVLAAWTPFGIVSTWFGFVLTAAVVIATVIAIQRCWEHEADQVATPQAQPVDA
jgi:Na+-driven multidrug efflux pump